LLPGIFLSDRMMSQEVQQINTTCCIAGGGPAGIILGYLLARAGIDVVVLEKHEDFNRDFRGDTIHPSTFQLIHELGLLDEFLKIPHQEVQQLHVIYNNRDIHLVDCTHLPVVKPAIGFMPQWDFLNFFTAQARSYPTFKLLMQTEAMELLRDNGRVSGVGARALDRQINIHAHLVIGADGRSSKIREMAGLGKINIGAPIDVLWFRVSRQRGDPVQALLGRFLHGNVLIMIEREKHWQIGYILDKGMFDKKKALGLGAFKAELVTVAPFFASRTGELKTSDDIKLLSVTIDRLKKWYTEGLLCIGDAAHAMSPVGGVGINLAIQDAVATANILAPALKGKNVTTHLLGNVQSRREFPAKATQDLQVFIQKGLVYHRSEKGADNVPFLFRLLDAVPFLRRIPARLIGMGFRAEHVSAPEYPATLPRLRG